MFVKNPTEDAPILDYLVDSVTYSVPCGEVVELPDAAANYLRKIYPFLEEVQPEPEKPAKAATLKDRIENEIDEEVEAPEKVACEFCGKKILPRGLAMHIGRNHKDKK